MPGKSEAAKSTNFTSTNKTTMYGFVLGLHALKHFIIPLCHAAGIFSSIWGDVPNNQKLKHWRTEAQLQK